MSCDEIASLLSPYVDNELTLSECAKVNEHLCKCESCTAQFLSFQNLHRLMGESNLRYKLPSDLERRILKMQPRRRRFKTTFFVRNMGWIAALFVATIAISQFRYFEVKSQNELAHEVLSEHVRALQTGHLIEVVSTDQHTVKPWFNGKVDFSPVVKDLKEFDFPLIGGRIDYLSGHPVATIVFQRRKHVIDLFVWPEESVQKTGEQSFSINGYNILKWSSDGFLYWAISDLNSTELNEFTQYYKNKKL